MLLLLPDDAFMLILLDDYFVTAALTRRWRSPQGSGN
jgi:hypothetical protein